MLDGILSSQTVRATLLLPEFSFFSLEVLLALLTLGSVTDKDLSREDIAEVKSLIMSESDYERATCHTLLTALHHSSRAGW